MIKQQRDQNIDNIHMDQLQSWMRNQDESNHYRDHVDDIDNEQEIYHDHDHDDNDEKKEFHQELAPQLQTITSGIWDQQPEKSSSPPLDLENILEEMPSKKADNVAVSDADTYDSTDSRDDQVLVTNDDKSEAYKSLSKISNEENNKKISSLSETTSPVMVQVTIDGEQDNDDDYDERLNKFGNVEIATLTKSIGGKSNGDILLLRDIIKQFQTVIKQHARVKLIKSYASKKIKVNEFKSREEIYGLLELIISCVIK
eukprot:CAMPEP_0201584626 /NCGR_PEP_ID=MMETSP0190_2-20130828/113056_1 /ASSEMBLY_ACC=CAM_ASM_000263 /TAXON_ID=37353 /ORGANISM="Rosalina sp." /LENGTH=256 /DNA_ID=CAMNT_0048028969 /DNA_START=531 /DNA_END=1298 /DNA_ORIENTATION=+